MAEPAIAVAAERPAAESFEALYSRTFPRVYAYVLVALGWWGIAAARRRRRHAALF